MIKNKKTELTQEEFSEKILLRQIREEARREKIQLLIIKYKNQLIYGLLLVAVFAIIFSYYNSYQQKKNEKYSDLAHKAMNYETSGNITEAFKILENIKNDKSAPTQIKSISSIKYASHLVDQNKLKEAVEIYLKINEDRKVDQYLKELSGLLALKTMIDSDDKDSAEKIEKLIPVLEKNSTILKPMILEQKAIFYLLQNKLEEAKKIFENLSLDLETPQDLKNRAKEFIKIIKNK